MPLKIHQKISFACEALNCNSIAHYICSEIKIVRRRWKSEREELAGGGVGSGNAASKIIEFSKKIRELNTAVEKEKSRSQTLEKKLREVEHNNCTIVKLPPTPTETDHLQAELTTAKEVCDLF